MSIDLPTPIGLKLLNGLLGNGNGGGPHGVGHGHGGPNDVDNDHGGDAARQAKESALQTERTVEAGHEQGRWQQTEGPNNSNNNGWHKGQLENQGPQGPNQNHPGNSIGDGDGGLPRPGELLSNTLGKVDNAVRDLLGQNGPLGKVDNAVRDLLGQNGAPGQLAKSGSEMASQLLTQTGQGVGLAAKALESLPTNAAHAAGVLLNQAAQTLNSQGAQALAARNALHDAATLPQAASTKDAPLSLQNTLANNAIPANARAAESALIPGRQDAIPLRADQAALGRTATALPAGTTAPTTAPLVADAARHLPFAPPAAPVAVPPSQGPGMVEGRPGVGVGGGGGEGAAPAKVEQVPPGHTGAAPNRLRPEEEDGESLAQKMVRAVAAWLGLGAAEKQADVDTGMDEAPAPAANDEHWLRLQWLFWALAVAGYGCLTVAVVVLIPGGGGFLDETRNPIVWPALAVGLGSSIAAWWLGRKIARAR